MNVTLLTLTKYPDIFADFYKSVAQFEPLIPKVVVRDGDADIKVDMTWQVLQAPSPFIFSRNVNIGWNAIDGDVLFVSDDVRLLAPIADTLQKAAYRHPQIGVVVPSLGGCSPFVCGYFKREAIDAAGSMDESFFGYGKDDADFLMRMTRKNFFVHEIPDVLAEHPVNGTTYARTGGAVADYRDNDKRYADKWGAKEWPQEENWLEFRRTLASR